MAAGVRWRRSRSPKLPDRCAKTATAGRRVCPTGPA